MLVDGWNERLLQLRGAPRARRRSWPRRPPSDYLQWGGGPRFRQQICRGWGGGGWREGGGGQVCTGQTLNLSVLSLNVKRELLRSATFYTQCLIPLCHAKQGANGEKWGEGVGGWGSGEVFPQVWGASWLVVCMDNSTLSQIGTHSSNMWLKHLHYIFRIVTCKYHDEYDIDDFLYLFFGSLVIFLDWPQCNMTEFVLSDQLGYWTWILQNPLGVMWMNRLLSWGKAEGEMLECNRVLHRERLAL